MPLWPRASSLWDAGMYTRRDSHQWLKGVWVKKRRVVDAAYRWTASGEAMRWDGPMGGHRQGFVGGGASGLSWDEAAAPCDLETT